MGSRITIGIMAGGTGGHVFPALAVAEVLRQHGVEVFWIGTRSGMEARLVAEHGFELEWIDIAGVRGKSWATRLRLPFTLAGAVWQAQTILRRRQPALVLGMGGFVAGPGGLAARMLGIPLVIHEQNGIPGLTNRWLARLATQVFEAFPNSFPPARGAITVGNPVRQAILDLSLKSPPPPLFQRGEEEKPPFSKGGLGGFDATSPISPIPPCPPFPKGGDEKPPLEKGAATEPPFSKGGLGGFNLLILGGSLGAQALNEIVPAALAALPEAQRPQVRHQAGERTLQLAQAAYQTAGISAEITPFINDMAAAYDWADLVICRAGALTIAELAAAGVASVLVPYPFAVDDHQVGNARYLSDAGAARLVLQRDLSASSLSALLTELFADRSTLSAMSARARQLAQPDATARIAAACLAIAHRDRPADN
ncbi:undecaprenyldiphospho-muramoylpentapeptide beta-N-acetylglucosaminyltransferase [Chromatium okenii]|uniref:undecaprenyldiphospho-muramoylpentapeptide beta-N-acetylglucosaminyltransferase n=1 Tax=Chromatium okenii TaxID=61644 RepID=UPI0026EA8BE4|nr:undecaprenyldiphospho-muramoylpentapeptide beta-N-acetylglucosaminyltransferase [Chromatium okenii]MBV5311412.1 undecaprenyldiphospho-muramoylpentapeptide beta-N-acetylglucosaminyltransferase [Chromatium okenii]